MDFIKNDHGVIFYSQWNEVFAWYPVCTISKKRVWWKKLYKRKCLEVIKDMQGVISYTYFEYATSFDILQLT